MPALWEYRGSTTLRKQLGVFHTRPDPTTGAYGPTFVYDDTPPEEVVTIAARGMDRTEVDAEKTKVRTRGTNQIYALADGQSVTGLPYSIADVEIAGTGLYEVTVELRVAT